MIRAVVVRTERGSGAERDGVPWMSVIGHDGRIPGRKLPLLMSIRHTRLRYFPTHAEALAWAVEQTKGQDW